MCEKILAFDFSTQVFTESGQVPLDRNCNTIVIKNTGGVGSVVIFKGVQLSPGESFTIGGNRAEILDARIDLVIAAASEATVIQKFYTGKCHESL